MASIQYDALPPQSELDDDTDSAVAGDSDAHEFDSAVEISDFSSYSTSLISAAQSYRYENGRRYHSYREGQYFLPNDELEQDRQNLLHHVRNLTLNGALFRAPLRDNVQHVLDIGTGTGIWAIDFADAYPSAKVIGTDLSPIQPYWVPPNVQFYVDDAESTWLFEREGFDFIHARDLAGGVASWPRLIGQAHEYLRPGGWIELQDFGSCKADDDSLKLAPQFAEWLTLLKSASAAIDRPLDVAQHHSKRLEQAGFTNVRVEVFKIPFSCWPQDNRLKQIGRYNQPAISMSLESYSMALFSRVLGWSQVEIQVYLSAVRKELWNPHLNAYVLFHVVYGQKPERKN